MNRAISPCNDLAGRGIDVSAGLEEERHVPDVVQAERNQRALDHAVDREGQRRSHVHRPMRERLDRRARSAARPR